MTALHLLVIVLAAISGASALIVWGIYCFAVRGHLRPHVTCLALGVAVLGFGRVANEALHLSNPPAWRLWFIALGHALVIVGLQLLLQKLREMRRS